MSSSIQINLKYLKENFLKIREVYPKHNILFMIKADAYGHGAHDILSFSFHELGIREFGLASLREALALRIQRPEIQADLYVFSDLSFDGGLLDDSSKDIYLNKRIIPVISNIDDLSDFLKDPDYKFVPLCLKFNTGMNRLGISHTEVTEVINLLKSSNRKTIFHLMSHFANGSLNLAKNNRGQTQIKRFAEIKEEILNSGLSIERSSMANSGAIEQRIGLDDTHIRPGLMMFGPSSLIPKDKNISWFKGKIVSELQAKVIKTFEVNKGDPLGYGSVPCPDDGLIAIINLGYGDGISTKFHGIKFKIQGESAQVCAKVCMDMTYLLFSRNTKIRRGDTVSLWKDNPDFFEQLSRNVGVIPYELVINLTSRLPRVYKLD